MIEWIIIGAIMFFVLVIIILLFYYYNRIIVLDNRIDNALSQIDVQLKKRADLVPNLVETVKGYAKHEKQVFEQVTNARKEFVKANSIKGRVEANNKLASALRSVFAIAENYPKLQASDNFKLLQEQLEGIENKIAYARQFYNDSILSYNNAVTTIPGRWFAGMLNKKPREFLQIEPGERKVIKVDFGK